MPAFDATLEEGRGGGALVAVPPDVVDALGGGGRIPVVATFDGVAYRGSVVSMGGRKVIGVLKAIREQVGKHPGDTVAVTLERDTAERTVEVPDDLAAALAAAGRADAFAALGYSHRREYVQWIAEAKRPETRARRVAQTVDRVGATPGRAG
jgi:hypothetical protein